MPPTRRRPHVGWVAAAGAAALAVAWALICPWLWRCRSPQARALLPFEALAAVCSSACRLARDRDRGGARTARRGAARRRWSRSSAPSRRSASALGAVALARRRRRGRVRARRRRRHHLRRRCSSRSSRRGASAAVAATRPPAARCRCARCWPAPAGLLATAAWALASGHVLGQLHGDAERHAVDEARDLCAIVAERALISDEIDAIAPTLAPARRLPRLARRQRPRRRRRRRRRPRRHRGADHRRPTSAASAIARCPARCAASSTAASSPPRCRR